MTIPFKRNTLPCALVAFFALVLLTPASALAESVLWTLSGVTLSSGITVSGSFDFDADAGTACTAHASPCGSYSNIDVTTTAGGGLPASTFLYACGEDVATCTGVSPDSTEVLFLTSNAPDQSGLVGLALFFTGVGDAPPAGLSDAGGTLDVSNSSFSVGALQEAICSGASCGAPTSPLATSTAGSVVSATPEPPSLFLALLPVSAVFCFRRRWMSGEAI